MDVFVVVTSFMGAAQDGKVFASLSAARKFVDSTSKAGNPVVSRYSVIGELTEPGIVYTSSWYERSSDVHHLEGVYGSYNEAKQAAGEHGIALRREIE